MALLGFRTILLLTYARRLSVRTRAANGIRDNDIHKALTALCKQRSSCITAIASLDERA